MELIIKCTELCNFKCTFCSSTNIAPDDDRAKVLDVSYIIDFLKRYPETNTIIVNGGDPLMVKPEYYWEIINWLDDNNYTTSISFTSNLWAFYKKPDMWIDVFNHWRCGVTTSFNYGETRRVTEAQDYTEVLFWDVSTLMLDKLGYRPDFISVINEENESTALDNVRLAERMGVECKLNYAMASGDQSKPYQLSKMYSHYLAVYRAGLMEWEYHPKQMVKRLKGGATSCPQMRTCDQGIRSMNPRLSRDPKSMVGYHSCGSFDDDNEKPINFHEEVLSFGPKQLPLSNDIMIDSMHGGCYSCPMFKICNGCKKTISDHKRHNMVDAHCTLMKTLSDEIEAIQS